MKSRTEVSSRSWVWLGPLLVASLAIAVAFFFVRRPHEGPAPLNERSRQELVLKDGRLFERDGVTPFSGVVFETYDGGEMKSRSTVSNGLLQGLSQGWWTNGVLQVTEFFSNGISHGERTKYYSDGSKLSVVRIVNGRLEGRFERWHENGNVAEQVYLKNGVPDGESFAYHPDGSLKARVRLDQGKVVEQTFWASGEAHLAAGAPAISASGQ